MNLKTAGALRNENALQMPNTSICCLEGTSFHRPFVLKPTCAGVCAWGDLKGWAPTRPAQGWLPPGSQQLSASPQGLLLSACFRGHTASSLLEVALHQEPRVHQAGPRQRAPRLRWSCTPGGTEQGGWPSSGRGSWSSPVLAAAGLPRTPSLLGTAAAVGRGQQTYGVFLGRKTTLAISRKSWKQGEREKILKGDEILLSKSKPGAPGAGQIGGNGDHGSEQWPVLQEGEGNRSSPGQGYGPGLGTMVPQVYKGRGAQGARHEPTECPSSQMHVLDWDFPDLGIFAHAQGDTLGREPGGHMEFRPLRPGLR